MLAPLVRPTKFPEWLREMTVTIIFQIVVQGNAIHNDCCALFYIISTVLICYVSASYVAIYGAFFHSVFTIKKLKTKESSLIHQCTTTQMNSLTLIMKRKKLRNSYLIFKLAKLRDQMGFIQCYSPRLLTCLSIPSLFSSDPL